MIHGQSTRNACLPSPRGGFTLVELLVAISIITLLASMVIVTMASVEEAARVDRTKAQIARLNQLIMEQWEAYETRRVPLKYTPAQMKAAKASGVRGLAIRRLNALRELMRLELPDRASDITDDPITRIPLPSSTIAYRGRVVNADPEWWKLHQGAECLYMIISRIQVGDSNGLQFFTDSEIGDVDADGMPEILDAWGTPIRFLRWPAAYESPLQDLNPQNSNDTFDPSTIYPQNYAIYPLILSAGPDREFGIGFDAQNAIHYSQYNNDPYAEFGQAGRMGQVDLTTTFYQDNIDNHSLYGS